MLRGSGAARLLYRVFRMHTVSYREAILYNVLVFVPVGYLLPAWSPRLRRWWRVVIVAALASLCVEVTQELTGFGMFDVMDIAANTIGAGIGAALACWVGV